MKTQKFTAKFPVNLKEGDGIGFGLYSRQNLGTSAGFGSPIMIPIATDVGYEFVKNYTVSPIDGMDDHTFRVDETAISVNITQGMRGVLDEKSFDDSDSFRIHSLTVFADRVEVICGVADRSLCHVGVVGWPNVLSRCF